MMAKHHTIVQFVTTTFLNNSLWENILSKVIRTRHQSPHTCLICGHNNYLKLCFERSHWISLWEKAQKMLNLVLNLFSKMYIKILIGLFHDSQSSFDCSICDINFSLKCTLRKHVKQIYENKSKNTNLWPQLFCKMYFEKSYWISSWAQGTKILNLVPNLFSKMCIKILIG